MTNELRQFKRCVRLYDELAVVFDQKDTIYLIDEDHATIIQRWWKVRNSWPAWRKMVKSLKTRKSLNYGQALGLAIRYGFEVTSARKVPKFDDYEIVKWKVNQDEEDD